MTDKVKGPRPEDHASYITVYESIGGWKAVMIWWNSEDFPGSPDNGYWEPYQTGCGAYATKAEAEDEAKWWATDEQLEYKEA